MAGNLKDNELSVEIAELGAILARVQAPGLKIELGALLAKKQAELAVLESKQAAAAPPVVQQEVDPEDMEVEEVPTLPKQEPIKVASHVVRSHEVDDLTRYTEISRFGWEDDGAFGGSSCNCGEAAESLKEKYDALQGGARTRSMCTFSLVWTASGNCQRRM